jgi:sphinganine-1-phosphate aldolase
MTLKLFNADPECVGCLTTGGSESIILAMHGYRERGRTKGIEKPEIVAPVTIHASIEKAAHYFNIELIHVPVDPHTY